MSSKKNSQNHLVKNEEKLDSDGIVDFLKDINVDPLDPTTLAFSYLCGAKTMVWVYRNNISDDITGRIY